MKETNDKIVQEYIERAGHIMIPKGGNNPNTAISNIIEIAKMIQLEDLNSRRLYMVDDFGHIEKFTYKSPEQK